MDNIVKKSFFKWFFSELYFILKRPNIFFTNIQFRKFSNRSVWFGSICLFIGIGGKSLIEIIFLNYGEEIYRTLPSDDNLNFLHILHVLKMKKQVILVLLPIISFFSIYLFSGILYAIIKIFKLNSKNKILYENILEFVSFCQAPMFFSFIPLFSLFAFFWCIYLLFKGMKTLYSGSLFLKLFIILISSFLVEIMWASSFEMIASSLTDDIFMQDSKSEIIKLHNKKLN